MYLLEIEPLDLGEDVRAMGLELTEADDNREPIRGADAAALVVSTSWVPKAIAGAESESVDGGSYEPLNDTLWGLPVTSSAKDKVAEKTPIDGGVNVTCTTHGLASVTTVGAPLHPFEEIANAPGSLPPIVTPVTSIELAAVSEKVTDPGAVVACVETLPKLIPELSDALPIDAVPVPESTTVCGVTAALSAIERAALCAAVVGPYAGVNSTSTVQ